MFHVEHLLTELKRAATDYPMKLDVYEVLALPMSSIPFLVSGIGIGLLQEIVGRVDSVVAT